jgi:hypothetical protein
MKLLSTYLRVGAFFNVRFQILHNRTQDCFLLHYSHKEVQIMARFIEEFYYGNINPQARSTRQNKTVQKETAVLTKTEELLTNALKDEPLKWFLDFANAWSIVNGESNLDSFVMGFRLGANFAYDAFISTEAPFEDLLKT